MRIFQMYHFINLLCYKYDITSIIDLVIIITILYCANFYTSMFICTVQGLGYIYTFILSLELDCNLK